MRVLALALLFSSTSVLGKVLLEETFTHVLNGSTQLTPQLVDSMYEHFLAEYRSEESMRLTSASIERKEIFAAALQDIIAHNTDETTTWKKGVNAFTDMTHEEFVSYYHLGADQVCTVAPPSLESTVGDYLPAKWDWRDFGAVTPVKNQGACGSCWTFSTVGVIESHFMLKYGQFRNMSEQ